MLWLSSGMSSWDPNPAKGIRLPFSNLNFDLNVWDRTSHLWFARWSHWKKGTWQGQTASVDLCTSMPHSPRIAETSTWAQKSRPTNSVGQYVTPLSARSSALIRRSEQDGSTGLPAYGYDVVVPWLPIRHENHETRGYEELCILTTIVKERQV